MTETPRGRVVGSADKAEIIDRLYEVAVDPVRYEELLDVWEGRVAPLRLHADGTTGVALSDSEIEAHFERASIFLDRYEATSAGASYQAALDDISRSAAFVSDGSEAIVAVNEPAERVFGLKAGSAIGGLPFDEDDIAALLQVIRRVARRQDEKAVTMRLRPVAADRPVIVRIMPVASDDARALALVVSTELAWPAGFDQTMQEAFTLTDAEIEIVRAITEGKQLKDIAEARGRSVETVRTQLRSILAKTETHSQSELVRVTLNLMDVVSTTTGMQTPPRAHSTAPGPLKAIPFSSFTQPDGRRYDYIEFGDPNGTPCLYMHMDYGLIRWPRDAELHAAQNGMRVIVPIRAGYGHSDPLPPGAKYAPSAALDMARLLDHLGVTRVAVLSQGADLRFAMELANARPDLVEGLVACGGTLPLQTPAQYERMDKWQRFILANARYAPKILPFLVKAGFALARRVGKEQFFNSVNAASPGDLRTFGDPQVREAMLLGSEVCLSNWHSAHNAFARECLDSETDWSDVVHACKAPAVLLMGAEDPQAPRQTVEELMPVFPHLRVEFVEDAGQLVFFQEWRRAVALLQQYLPAIRSAKQ